MQCRPDCPGQVGAQHGIEVARHGDLDQRRGVQRQAAAPAPAVEGAAEPCAGVESPRQRAQVGHGVGPDPRARAARAQRPQDPRQGRQRALRQRVAGGGEHDGVEDQSVHLRRVALRVRLGHLGAV